MFSLCSNCGRDILDKENIEWLTFDKQFLRCLVKDVYDGDTITVAIPLNKKPYLVKCRLSGIDAPEIRTKNIAEKKAGIKSKEFLSVKILNKKIWVECGKWDKYGRLLITIYMEKNKKTCINLEMVNNNLAVKYDGKKKSKF